MQAVREKRREQPGAVERVDHHYDRIGRRELFMMAEALAAWRHVNVTVHRDTERGSRVNSWLMNTIWVPTTSGGANSKNQMRSTTGRSMTTRNYKIYTRVTHRMFVEMSRRDPKIIRLIDKYDLEGMESDLEAKWTRKGSESRYSIRDLETYFNQAIVQSVFNKIGAVPTDYSAQKVYEILSSDDVSVADETYLRTWFEERGIDPDELATDFLSYHSIYVYLREKRGVNPPDTPDTSPEEEKQQGIDRMDRLNRRVEKVCEKTISTLQNTDVLPEGDLTFRINFHVECPECMTRSSITTYIYNEGCPVCPDHGRSSAKKESTSMDQEPPTTGEESK